MNWIEIASNEDVDKVMAAFGNFMAFYRTQVFQFILQLLVPLLGQE